MATKKKVGIVHVPYHVRGGEDVHVDQLKASYEKLGFGVVDWTKHFQSGSEAVSAAVSLTSGQTRAWEEFYKDCQIAFLHIHNVHPVFGPAFLRWVAKKKIPALQSIHNHRFYCSNGLALYKGAVCKVCRSSPSAVRPVVWNCNSSLPKSTYHSLALAQIRGADLLNSPSIHLLAPTSYMVKELEAAGVNADKIRLLPYGVDVSEIRRASLAKGADVVYAGRLSEEKGVLALLKAAEGSPEISYVIIGEGPLEPEVRSAAESLKNLRYAGKIPRPDMLAEMAASRVACVPSICEECYSLVSAEALSLGLQLVVSDSESLRHFREKGLDAIGATPGDSTALLAAIRQALQRPKRSSEETESIRTWLGMDIFREGLVTVLRELIPESQAL